jgi:hypothetical protein
MCVSSFNCLRRLDSVVRASAAVAFYYIRRDFFESPFLRTMHLRDLFLLGVVERKRRDEKWKTIKFNARGACKANPSGAIDFWRHKTRVCKSLFVGLPPFRGDNPLD